MIREHPETNAYYFDTAQIYTSCSTTVVPSASGSVDRRMFAESCSALAIGMLVEAEKSGYFRSSEGVELLKTDEGLDPLRSREDFRQTPGPSPGGLRTAERSETAAVVVAPIRGVAPGRNGST